MEWNPREKILMSNNLLGSIVTVKSLPTFLQHIVSLKNKYIQSLSNASRYPPLSLSFYEHWLSTDDSNSIAAVLSDWNTSAITANESHFLHAWYWTVVVGQLSIFVSHCGLTRNNTNLQIGGSFKAFFYHQNCCN